MVIEVDQTNKKAYVIGGNVGQSVSKAEVNVTADGRLDDSYNWLVHIQNNIEGERQSNDVVHGHLDFVRDKVG